MRAPFAVLAGSLLLACSSGTRIIYVPAPATAPVPPARTAPAPMPPVGVTIVRVDDRRLLVTTNQPAYLAVFEIVPNRGVTLVYPASPRQRQLALSGSHWLTVAWRAERGAGDDDRFMRGDRLRSSVHHVYAIASDRPLRLTDGAFDDDGLRTILGARAHRAAEPYATMTALSRRFVPPGVDEDWGEDVYTMDARRPSVTVRIAKIYCPDGSVTYVLDDFADRAACPYRGRGRGTGSVNAPVPRPDSVVASNGRPVRRRVDPAPARIFRVPTPVDVQDGAQQNGSGESVAESRPADGNGGRDANDDSAKDGGKGKDKQGDGKQNNGNHYGWENGNKGEKDKGDKGDKGDKRDKDNNGNHYGQDNGSKDNKDDGSKDNKDNGSKDNKDNGNKGNSAERGIQLQGKPERPPQNQPSEPKTEQPPVTQPEANSESKPKSEPKGMRGVIERVRENAKAAAAEATPAASAPEQPPVPETKPDSAAQAPAARRGLIPKARPDSSDAKDKKEKPDRPTR